MIVLWILLGLLILLLITPVGVEAVFIDGVFSLAVKIGPVRIKLLPQKAKNKASSAEEAKAAKEIRTKEAKKQKEPNKPKQKLTKEDILGIVKLALKAIGRFRRSLRLVELMLHLMVTTGDPYDTVMLYGYINAVLGVMLPLLHNAFKVCREDISTDMDFQLEKMAVEAKLTATLRIGQILYIALCAGGALLVWWYRRKRWARIQNRFIVSKKGI